MELFSGRKIRIQSSLVAGFGVFAIVDICKDELIEECLFLALPLKPFEVSSLFIDHRFNYPAGQVTANSLQVIVLGAASLYNHKDDASAYWITDLDRKTFKFYASKPIKAGEEIFVYYGDVNYWKDGRNNTVIK